MRVICVPTKDPLAEIVTAVAASAARRLGLDPRLASLTVCLDDIADDPRVWLALRSAGPALPQRWQATIYLHPDRITRDRPGRLSLVPDRQIWERADAAYEATSPGPEDFRRPKAERSLFHQLLWVEDLITELITPDELPRALVEAFQEGWAATVDGRLRRRHLPGHSVADRRASFSRLFSRAGVLLPEHWRIFHRLWEGTVTDQEAVLAQVRRLPRLTWRHQ